MTANLPTSLQVINPTYSVAGLGGRGIANTYACKNKVYRQFLCLLAKLFLDLTTLYVM